eukprot:Nk52_evm3s340 gene=Nk52_evmTU3s340
MRHITKPVEVDISDNLDVVAMKIKAQEEYRNYTDSPRQDVVCRTYTAMHESQTVQFVQNEREKWGKLNHCEATIFECMELLNLLVDDSDPDVDIPNSVHAYQTAERIRKAHPDEEWFHLTGFIHDLGKVLAMWDQPQWAVVGDTFPVGCKFSSVCVFPETFEKNPDSSDPKYNTKYGMYKENVGLDNVLMSWGHDEYMYQVLTNNPQVTLPKKGLDVIRYHSFYPWHTSKDYMYLCDEKDMNETLPWVLEFNKFDLYSKGDEMPDVDEIKPYYEGLVEKYMPGKLRW